MVLEVSSKLRLFIERYKVGKEKGLEYYNLMIGFGLCYSFRFEDSFNVRVLVFFLKYFVFFLDLFY